MVLENSNGTAKKGDVILKLTWVHDHFFIKDLKENIVYSEIEFSNELWEKYLVSFDEITILSRQRTLNENENTINMNTSSRDNVSFKKLPNLNSLKNILTKRNLARKLIRQELKNSNGLIARLPSTLGILAIKEAKKLNMLYGVELVGCPSDALKGLKTIQGSIYAPLLTHQTKMAVENASHVLYVTHDFLQNRYPTQGKSIGCSDVKLEKALLIDINTPKNFVKNLESEIVIGIIGYLSNYKGIDTAFASIKKLNNKYPNIKLKILGGGDVKFWLDYSLEMGLKQNQVSIESFADKRLVMKWLHNLDIYIQPSRTEGMPRALIEAMSVGCPCIASNVGGIPELVQEKFLHHPEDFNQLSILIESLINDKELYYLTSMYNIDVSKRYDFKRLEKNRVNFWSDYKNKINIKDSEVIL